MAMRGFPSPVTELLIYPRYVHPRDEPTGCKESEKMIIDPSLMILSIIYIVIGFMITFAGYRYYKTTMFLIGFTMGTLLIYVICLQKDLLSHSTNVIVSVIGGVLFGSIVMMIQCLGLLINGMQTGVLVAVAGLAVYDHVLMEYPNNYFLCVATMMLCGIFFATANLYWKRSMTIIGTALYGAGLYTVSIDYFYERGEMLKWLLDRAMLKAVMPTPCNLTWLILSVWLVVAMLGTIVQWFVSGTGRHHELSQSTMTTNQLAREQALEEIVQSENDLLIRRTERTGPTFGQQTRERPMLLKELYQHEFNISAQQRRLQLQLARPVTREQRDELNPKEYRRLARIAHDDVILQSYVNAHQNNAQVNNSNVLAVGEWSTLKSASTHLTVLPGSDHHNESDEEMRQIRSDH